MLIVDDERAQRDWPSPNVHPPWSICSASGHPAGTPVTPDSPDIAWLEETAAAVRVDDISTYIYTSGTTGHPKAVVLNHHNFTAVIDAAARSRPLEPESARWCPCRRSRAQRFTQYLGLVDQTEVVRSPSTPCPTPSPSHDHVLAAVPRMLEKIKSQVDTG